MGAPDGMPAARPDLERQIHDLNKVVALVSPRAPVAIEVGERLGGDGFLQRFPGRLELPYPVRCRGEHGAILHEVAPGAEWAVARHDLGVRSGKVEQAVTRLDHAVHSTP